jgi:hypothetical protein
MGTLISLSPSGVLNLTFFCTHIVGGDSQKAFDSGLSVCGDSQKKKSKNEAAEGLGHDIVAGLEKQKESVPGSSAGREFSLPHI